MNVLFFGINDNNDINQYKFGLLQLLIAGNECFVNIVDVQTGQPEYNFDFIGKNINRYSAQFKTHYCVNTMYFSKNDDKTFEWVVKNPKPCQHESEDTSKYVITKRLFQKIINHLARNPITTTNIIYCKKKYTCHYGVDNVQSSN